MGLFNKGEDAANGIRRSLRKRGISADVTVYKGEAYATAEDVFAPGTELFISWARKELSVTFSLGTNPALYSLSTGLVSEYNASGAPFSRAAMCQPSQVNSRDYHKVWIDGFMPGASIADKTDEVETFLDMILEDIFDTHASVMKRLFINAKLAALS